MEARESSRARVVDVLAATEAAEDRLTNQLARITTRCELLAEDPTLPEEAREQARRASAAAYEAAETLREFIRTLRSAGAPLPAHEEQVMCVVVPPEPGGDWATEAQP